MPANEIENDIVKNLWMLPIDRMTAFGEGNEFTPVDALRNYLVMIATEELRSMLASPDLTDTEKGVAT